MIPAILCCLSTTTTVTTLVLNHLELIAVAEQTQERTPEPNERDIFRFHDGTRQRAMDPMKIWAAMWLDDDIDIGKLLDRMATNELEAVVELLPRARKWLQVPEFNEQDETGMTDLEFCRVMYSWFNFVIDIKKKRGQLPIPLRLLQQRNRGNHSTTPPDSDSSSMPSESPSEEPTTASKPSPAPSVAV